MIRLATTADLKELLNLEREIFSDENYPLSLNSFRYHINKNLLLDYILDKKIVGYILILTRKKSAKIYSLAVLKEHRKNEIASLLIDHALSLITDYEDIYLEVRVDNLSAIKLYESKKFKIIQELQEFYKDGCNAYIMKLYYYSTK